MFADNPSLGWVILLLLAGWFLAEFVNLGVRWITRYRADVRGGW